MVSYLVENLNKLNNDQCLEVGNHAISLFTGGLQLIFEQEDTKFKKEIAEVLSAREDYEAAARILEKVNVE